MFELNNIHTVGNIKYNLIENNEGIIFKFSSDGISFKKKLLIQLNNYYIYSFNNFNNSSIKITVYRYYCFLGSNFIFNYINYHFSLFDK